MVILRQKQAFSLLSATAFATVVWAQEGSFNVRLSLKNVDCDKAKAHVMVEVKAQDDSKVFNMGDANYRFEYNANQIKNPVLVSQDGFSSQAATADRNYGAQNLQGSRAVGNRGIVSLNSFYTGLNAGAKLVQARWMPVATIGFDIADFRRPIELSWHDNKTFPVTGMNSVKITEPDPTTFEYQLADVSGGTVFSSLAVNTQASCPSKAPVVSPSPMRTKVNMPVEAQFPIYDADKNEVFSVKLLSIKQGEATPSVSGSFLKLHYQPAADFIGKTEATVEVSDRFGNAEIVTIPITVSENALTIYNGFSPNGDGVNDFFVVEGLEVYKKHKLTIYDHFGREVFQSADYKNNWDGKLEGKYLMEGTYYYILDVGNDEVYKGYVQLAY
jgi:gliding motility-associated-like protein